jgi:hypothetical protein
VVAAAAAGGLHLAGTCEAVGGLVQQRPQHFQGAALEAFAADQDLMAVGALDVPAVGREGPRLSRLPSDPEATTSTASGTSGWRVQMVCQVCSRAAISRLAVPSGLRVWLDSWPGGRTPWSARGPGG